MNIQEFIAGKLQDAEKALKYRKDSAVCWRGGTNESWRAVGCNLSKTQRRENADRQDRIAIKCETEVEMFKAVLAASSYETIFSLLADKLQMGIPDSRS